MSVRVSNTVFRILTMFHFSYRALLFGGLLESQKSEIELKGISAAAFHVLLKYVYTGYVSLSNMKVKNLLAEYNNF